MKMTALKVRTICKDTATNAKGMITHVVVHLDRTIQYVFAPNGLNDDGRPLRPHLVTAAQLSSTDFESIEVPIEVLGSKVTDDASGFTGTAIELWMHPNGCFHILVQPKSKAKDGELVKPTDFDVRQCSGPQIHKQTETAKEASRNAHPSPAPIPERR